MKLYRTEAGAVLESPHGSHALADISWDALISAPDLATRLSEYAKNTPAGASLDKEKLLAPIDTQELWACGVTYIRSRSARMEESQSAGGGDFYDRVYSAERPELFFKSSGWRVIGPEGLVRIRKDSTWDVPEPELTLVLASDGSINGYTIGNDMSSRSIEGENPLYLPQAKTYDGAAALGPCVYVTEEPLPKDTPIQLRIERDGKTAFEDATELAQLKRSPEELAEFLFRESSFPTGAYLMTGTGIVPDNDFTLQAGDIIEIRIGPIGMLRNTVA